MAKGKHNPFSKEDELFIKENYLKLPVKRIASILGCGGGRITRFLKKHKLIIPLDVVEQRKKDSQLKKGNIPMNKGLRKKDYMSPEAIERTRKTQFKKGAIPHNTKENGVIVCRKDKSGVEYMYIRIAKSNWKLLHRHVWESVHGQIEKGYSIIFIDKDTKNTNIENLRIVSREELMLINSKHKHPIEVIPSMVLCAKLEKLIKIKSKK